MADGEPLERFKPHIIVSWTDNQIKDWDITANNPVPLYEIRAAVGEYLLKSPPDQLGAESTELGKLIDAIGTKINEGNRHGIFLISTSESKIIIASAKNYDDGSTQITDDEKYLPVLAVRISQNQLKIPHIYSQIQLPMLMREPLPAHTMEFLEGFQELSCSAFESYQFAFDTNQPEIALQLSQSEHTPEIIRLLTDPKKIVADLARNQTLVYFALDGHTQKDFKINNGDYMVGIKNKQLLMSLITLGGGLEKMDQPNFIKRLLTHTEKGFNPRVGPQKQSVHPFAVFSETTLEAIYEGFLLSNPHLPKDQATRLFMGTMQETEQLLQSESSQIPKDILSNMVETVKIYQSTH